MFEGFLSATDDFLSWLNTNFEASNPEDVSTEQLLKMQKDQQRALLLVFGLSILAVILTVVWTNDNPFSGP